MAHALAGMKERGAAGLLAVHLLDPADTDDDIMQTAAALVVIGGSDQLPAMKELFAMYRSTAASDEVAAAVVSIGTAIAALDPGAGRAQMDAAAHDQATVEYARDRLANAIKAMAPAPAETEKSTKEKPASEKATPKK
jgi:outer membrane protein assembly factor BamB